MLSLSVDKVDESHIWFINSRANGSFLFQKYEDDISLVKGWGTNFIVALNFKVVYHVNFYT